MDSSKKAVPMTKDEAMLLVQLVGANKVITNKSTNATNNRMKEQAWQKLTNEFNSSVTFPRSSSQLRLKWENLKKTTRKRNANMRNSRNETRDKVLDSVSSLLSSTCRGLSPEFGGDAVKNKNFVVHPNVDEGVSGDGHSDDDGVCGGSVSEGEMLEIQILETPPPKQTNFLLNRANGSSSGTSAMQKHKMEEDKCKARISRDNAITEYMIAKKKKIDLEIEEKDILVAKLKLELEKL